jgi:hypothetical protein
LEKKEIAMTITSKGILGHFLPSAAIGGALLLSVPAVHWIYYSWMHPATVVRSPGIIVAKGTDKNIEPPNHFFDVDGKTTLVNDYFYVSDELWTSQKVGARVCVSKSTRKAVNDDGYVSHYGTIRLESGDCIGKRP